MATKRITAIKHPHVGSAVTPLHGCSLLVAAMRGWHSVRIGSGEKDTQWAKVEGEKVSFLCSSCYSPSLTAFPIQIRLPRQHPCSPSFLPACCWAPQLPTLQRKFQTSAGLMSHQNHPASAPRTQRRRNLFN